MKEKEKTKERSSKKGMIIALSIMSAITLAIYALSGFIFGETSVFNQAITSNSAINTLFNKIPAVLKSIQIVTISWLVILLIRYLMSKMWAKSNRGTTVVKLFNSFLLSLITS